MHKRSKAEDELFSRTLRALIYGSGRNCVCPQCGQLGTIRFYKEGNYGSYSVNFIHANNVRHRLTHVSLKKWFQGDMPKVALIVRLLQNLRHDPWADKVITWALDNHKPVDVKDLLTAHQRRIANHCSAPAKTVKVPIPDDREGFNDRLSLNDVERRDNFDGWRRNQ